MPADILSVESSWEETAAVVCSGERDAADLRGLAIKAGVPAGNILLSTETTRLTHLGRTRKVSVHSNQHWSGTILE